MIRKLFFESIFASELIDYIEYKESLGFNRNTYYLILRRFDLFLIEHNYIKDFIDEEIVVLWSFIRDIEGKNYRNKRLSILRGFTIYLNLLGKKSFIPKSQSSTPKKIPYVLNIHELKQIYECLDNLKTNYPNGVFCIEHYQLILPVFFRLVYSCGLRNGEACSIKIENINFDSNTIKIQHTKNYIDRIVYISETMMNLLSKYIDKMKTKYFEDIIYLFPSTCLDKHIDTTYTSEKFYRVIKKLKLGSKDFHPVVHSLRHSYVVHKIDEWINLKLDTNILTGYLAKQLGHKNIKETFYYYHIIENSLKPIRKFDEKCNIYKNIEVKYEEN